MGASIARWEIASWDPRGVGEFYSALFGWRIEGNVVRCGGGPDGYLFKPSGGIPPFVTIYVAVSSLEATLRRAGELGGQTYVPPTPGVSELGESAFAVIGDPDGTILGLSGPAVSRNGKARAESGYPVVWFEIHCEDADEGKRFYGELFDWEFDLMSEDDTDEYWIVDTAEESIGGALTEVVDGDDAQGIVFYVGVDSLEESLDRARSLGAEVVQDATVIGESAGSFALIRDPESNLVGMWVP